jgi:sulfur carrier protein
MIILNGRDYELDEEITVQELIDRCRFIFPMKVVKINGKLVKKEAYNKTIVKLNDKVEVIHLISGG